MALTSNGMATAIKAALGANGLFNWDNQEYAEKFCNALGKAVVEYITANADVIAEVQVTVPAGTGAIVPGTGKIV